tara:strand:- start:169 stop:438 length:270 start_codon:yes stop_codon:yes gene_type:complete
MNKKDISKNISNALNIRLNQSQSIVDVFLMNIKSAVKNKSVKINGFGTFYTHKTPKRIGRNPKTKESYIIHPRSKINFKPSYKARGTLN